MRHNELTIDPYAKQATEEASYERYDKLIAKMALPDYEYETLLAMMNGMRMIDMKRVFQRRLHHDLPPQTSYSEEIFTRRQRVAIGESFPKKHYNIKTNPNHSLVTSIRFGL